MRAVIQEVKFVKEYEGQTAPSFLFEIKYNDKWGIYSCKDKDQKYFIVGHEASFMEEERIRDDKSAYTVIRLIDASKSNFGKQIKKEQTRYSGFAYSYCKDLIVAGKIALELWDEYAKKVCDGMVKLDQNIIND
jgi:hypothetical protein